MADGYAPADPAGADDRWRRRAAAPALHGTGAMAEAIRAQAWARTPLGDPPAWPAPLRTLVELMLSSGQPMFIAWGSGQTWLYNDAFVPILGDKHPAALGRPALEVWHEARDELAPLFARVFAGEPVHMEDIALMLDRRGRLEESHFAFSYTPVRDASGDVAGLFGACIETTDRVLTARRQQTVQAELQSAERRQALLVALGDRLRDLSDPAELSYAAAELLGRALGVSRAGYGTIDLAAETITIERDWNAPGIASLAGTLHFRDYGSYIDDLKRGETVVFADARVDPRTRDTADALAAISALSVVNMPVTEQGGLVALLYLNHAQPRAWSAEELAFIREVAERTRAAVARRRAERNLLALAASLEQQVAERTAERDRVWRHSRDLLVVVGADGVFRAVNPAWTAILGHDATEVVGHHFAEFVWPADLEATQAALQRAVGALHLTDFENRYRHRDGTPRWISWHSAVEGGTVYAYGRDVSAAKEQARALEQAEAALRQGQKLEAMGQLTGGVAHDFNNLLAIVSNNLYLHRRMSPACEHSAQLNAIARAADTGARLTRQLLAFARRQAIRPEAIRLQDELPELRHVLQATLGGAISIRIDIDADLPAVRVDRAELELAVINLAMNARDAMPDGGVLSVRARRDGDAVALVVADTGQGIPPDVLPRVFEPFFTTKEPGRGTGLGLSQVYGFATQAGGSVDIASRPGHSTTVTVVLPATEAPPAAAAGTMPSSAAPLRARVLLVEDNPEVGATTRDLLQVAGCEVRLVTNGVQARDHLLSVQGADIDVVLSDIVMAGPLSGVALARWVDRERPGLPVLLATGYSSEMAAATEQGLTVLQKPVAPQTLIDAVRGALARRSGI